MRNLSRISLGLAAAGALVVSSSLPATASDIAVSANVAGQGISISVPTTNSLAFGTVVPGQSLSLGLTGITVTDQRAGTTPWSARVAISGFIDAANNPVDGFTLGYAPGVKVFTSGTGVVGVPTTVNPVLTTASQVQQPTSVLGNNQAVWDATVTLNVPGAALKGTYTTVLTHSVL